MMSLEWSKVRGVNAHLNPANTFKIFIQLGSILAVGGGVLVIERSELDEATKRASGIRPVA
jgi:undecaprenyl pyrophosphate phosphatase UppP